MPKYTYRTATSSDSEKLIEVGLKSFGQMKDQLTDSNWKRLEAYLTAENTYPDLLNKSTCFVCEHHDGIVGMAFLIPSGNPTDIFDENWSYLRMVGVNIEYAGAGIGTALTRMCIDHAIKTNEQTIALHTSELMNAARYIYEKLGFKKIRELDARFGKRYWLYLLEL
ncbi:GNAT family N-acetyltransferase [Dyadobacter psychrotolerans]|uniref:N-acetyltransferase n=1 Tax=Dyadobacter psychrotolerans TaxID=2541721 RepID=A0A4R5E0M4_9BACT|nr:GNAT family N-acetyltransferase [Dyadobacter psychrotolerans]TDE17335.1 N-acetyltransferase [Dyadobacter psychrotolerans]